MSERKSRDEIINDIVSKIEYYPHEYLRLKNAVSIGYDAREPEIKELQSELSTHIDMLERTSKECMKLQEKLSVARAALENIAKGTHEEFPTCMIGKNGFDYGPPRTGGWEGWARELRACNIEIAREALEKIKVT